MPGGDPAPTSRQSQMQRPSFLDYARHRFLKLALWLAGAALLADGLIGNPGGRAYASSWWGYGLGIACALLVLWLCWYGIRKRRTPKLAERRSTSRRWSVHSAAQAVPCRRTGERRKPLAGSCWRASGTLQEWLSAHVYLGLCLLVLTWLHSAGPMGWNVHSLTLVLVWLVVASGCYGTFAYVRYPRLLAENLGEDSLPGLLQRIAELDELARVRALGLPDQVNHWVATARRDTRLGGGLLQQLGFRPGHAATEQALTKVRELGRELVDGEQPRLMRDLYALLLQKQALVTRAHTAIVLGARLQFWLYLHVPLSLALLAALLAHTLVILIYW